jgi:hypothetical protein
VAAQGWGNNLQKLVKSDRPPPARLVRRSLLRHSTPAMHLQPTRSLFEVEIPEARASSRLGCTHDWPPKHHTGRISDFPAWDKSIPKLRGCPLLCSWIRAPTAVVTCTHNAAGLPDLAARHEEEDKIKKKRTRSGRRRRDQEEDDEISLWRLHLLNLGSLCSTPR